MVSEWAPREGVPVGRRWRLVCGQVDILSPGGALSI